MGVVGGADATVTVMTRNLYVGADLEATVGALLTGSPVDLGAAVRAVAGALAATDFRVRAGLVAGEIAAMAPDLVGLQEVARWTFASGPSVDFLSVLLGALGERGAAYDVVVAGDRADLSLPTSEESEGVGLTVRDVVLARSGAIEVTDRADRRYRRDLALDLAGVPLRFGRGFQWVDVSVGGFPWRFVNTHLEAYDADVATAQADELLAALPPDRTVVVVGDINAAPGTAVHDRLTATLDDLWLTGSPGDDGFTCGPSSGLVDDRPFFVERIDVALGRPAPDTRLVVEQAVLTGHLAEDRDAATGLWPSDHAGLVLRLSAHSRLGLR